MTHDSKQCSSDANHARTLLDVVVASCPWKTTLHVKQWHTTVASQSEPEQPEKPFGARISEHRKGSPPKLLKSFAQRKPPRGGPKGRYPRSGVVSLVVTAEQSIATERRIGSVLKSSRFGRRRLNRVVRRQRGKRMGRRTEASPLPRSPTCGTWLAPPAVQAPWGGPVVAHWVGVHQLDSIVCRNGIMMISHYIHSDEARGRAPLRADDHRWKPGAWWPSCHGDSDISSPDYSWPDRSLKRKRRRSNR